MGNWSIRLLTVRGIEIKVHLSFILILIWAAYFWGAPGRGATGALFGIVVTLLVFVCVVLHELGHSFEAMRFGVKVRDITLWPIGGVARLESIPEKPIQELRIALAGPLVNFAIVLALWVFIEILFRTRLIESPSQLLQMLGEANWQGLLSYIFIANLALGLFNLVPAFPMDGGRVLRSLLALKMEYARATRIAVIVGQGLAILMGLWGFMSGSLSLILVGIFVFWGAGQEGRLVEVRSVLRGLLVGHAHSRNFEVLAPSDRLSRAVELTLNSFQSDFPVLDGDRLAGLLTESDLLSALHKLGPEAPVASAMRVEFPVARPEMTLFEAQQAIAAGRSSAVPVMEDGKLIGILTLRDISEIYRLLSAKPELILRT